MEIIKKYILTQKLSKALLIVSFVFFCIFNLSAQVNKKADSLIHILDHQNLSDSLRLEILEELAKDHTLKPETKLIYNQKLFDLAIIRKDSLWLYKSNLRFGHTYKKTGDLHNALRSYLNALKYAEKLDDERRIGLTYSAIGSLYKVNDDYEKALYFFNKAINILADVKDTKNLAITLTNAAHLYKLNEAYDSALLYFDQAGEIFDSINFLKGKAYNLGNIGIIFKLQNDYDKAIPKLKEAIEMLETLRDLYPIAVYDQYLVNIYKDKGDFLSALSYAHHSLKIAEENGLKEQIRDVSKMLAELYAKDKSFEKAYYFQNQYITYRDSINNDSTIREMADLRTEYEVAQKQAEVDLLKTKRERQNTIFAALIVVITLLTFLVFLYYRNYKRKQTLNYIITERKEEIEAQRDQLEALNETKEKFLSIVSHDLLGPVNSFKGLSTIMKASIEAKDINDLEQIHQLFDKSVNNLSTLLTNLLDWSVTQQGAIPYEPEEIVVSDVVNELLSLFSNMAATKNILLQSTIAESTTIWADKNCLKTILRNLLSNAIKFTGSEGQIILSNIVLEDTVGIQVTDTGLGMPQDKINQLLAQYTFGHSQGTSGEKGVGLGLQLVKEFTETNKGTLSIESEEGNGTIITVYLPIIETIIIE